MCSISGKHQRSRILRRHLNSLEIIHEVHCKRSRILVAMNGDRGTATRLGTTRKEKRILVYVLSDRGFSFERTRRGLSNRKSGSTTVRGVLGDEWALMLIHGRLPVEARDSSCKGTWIRPRRSPGRVTFGKRWKFMEFHGNDGNDDP